MGCDAARRVSRAGSSVSIHAPAWGATQCNPVGRRPDRVSIHAPAWGATSRHPGGPEATPCFNPRTRMGCDIQLSDIVAPHHCFNPRTRMGCDAPVGPRKLRVVQFQSTHPHGVRHLLHARHVGAEVSIHAPAWGATPAMRITSLILKFQSTHPHGVRPSPDTAVDI